MISPGPDPPESPTAPPPQADQTPPADQAFRAQRSAGRTQTSRAWLVALAALVAALIGSAIVMMTVVRPPSYEPVPIPSVSST